MILIVTYVLLSIAILAVVLRLCLRSILRHGVSSDDYAIAASLVGFHSDESDRVRADHLLDCWNNRGRLPNKTRPRRNGKAHILPSPYTAIASP